MSSSRRGRNFNHPFWQYGGLLAVVLVMVMVYGVFVFLSPVKTVGFQAGPSVNGGGESDACVDPQQTIYAGKTFSSKSTVSMSNDFLGGFISAFISTKNTSTGDCDPGVEVHTFVLPIIGDYTVKKGTSDSSIKSALEKCESDVEKAELKSLCENQTTDDGIACVATDLSVSNLPVGAQTCKITSCTITVNKTTSFAAFTFSGNELSELDSATNYFGLGSPRFAPSPEKLAEKKVEITKLLSKVLANMLIGGVSSVVVKCTAQFPACTVKLGCVPVTATGGGDVVTPPAGGGGDVITPPVGGSSTGGGDCVGPDCGSGNTNDTTVGNTVSEG